MAEEQIKKVTKEMQISPRYEVKPDFKSEKLPEKEKILNFMKSQEKRGVKAGWFSDEGKTMYGFYIWSYKFGGFYWDDAVIYCFEKYDIKLDPEFAKIATQN